MGNIAMEFALATMPVALASLLCNGIVFFYPVVKYRYISHERLGCFRPIMNTDAGLIQGDKAYPTGEGKMRDLEASQLAPR
jgi:hypothetical protein